MWQSTSIVGCHEDESFSVICDACQFYHSVVVVQQLRRQFSAANKDNDQIFVTQSKDSRQLNVLPLLIVIDAQSLLFIHLNRTQMNLYALIASNGFHHFIEPVLPCFEGFHKHIVPLFYLLLKEEPQQLSFEESLYGDRAFSESLVLISNASHPPKSNNLICCSYLSFFSVELPAKVHSWPCWQIYEAI